MELLRRGFDITTKDVADELKRYDVAIGTPYPQYIQSMKEQLFWNPGASNPHAAVYVSFRFLNGIVTVKIILLTFRNLEQIF